MNERIVDVFNIGSRKEAVIGSHYSVRYFEAPPIPVMNSQGDMAMYLDGKVETKTSYIERISFRDHYNRVTEKFITIDPKDRDEILLLVGGSEINRLERALRDLEKMWDRDTSKLKKIVTCGFFTRLKWLFTGIKLEQEASK